MAITLDKVGNTYNIPLHTYTVDSSSELSSIKDAPIHSRAFSLSDKTIYIADASGAWTAF